MSAEELTAHLRSLCAIAPTEPNGGFRWMHHAYLVRMDQMSERIEDEAPWLAVKELLPAMGADAEALLIEAFNRHARTFGQVLFVSLAERCWSKAEQTSRGNFIAGMTNRMRGDEIPQWVRCRLPDASLTAMAVCEIGVNAILFKIPDLLDAILAQRETLLEHVPRSEPLGDDPARWESQKRLLSDRVVDLLLEASLRLNYVEGAVATLNAGADPNLSIWCLDRSYNARYCALSYAISQEATKIAEALIRAGAAPDGTDYGTLGQPLFAALYGGSDALAEILLDRGATFTVPPPANPESMRRMDGHKMVPMGRNTLFFGNMTKDLEWTRQALGGFIPLTDVVTKPSFYKGDGQGGHRHTFFSAVLNWSDNLARLRKYEARGMDTTLSDEDLCSLIAFDAFDCLAYLLGKHGGQVRDRAFFRIRRRKPKFGSYRHQIDGLPQADGINLLDDFDPGDQVPMTLADGSKLYANLDAIAPPDHPHGPCSENEFFCRKVTATFRRRGNRVFITELLSEWVIEPKPKNPYQLLNLLPAVKLVGGHYIWLGVSIGRLPNVVSDRGLQSALYAWIDSPDFQPTLDEAVQRGADQDRTNRRPRKPNLSDDELDGYPRHFWPYLIRLPNGLIGMTEESCVERPSMLRIYLEWENINKPDLSSIPDPRLSSWDGWNELPEDFKPFFAIDPTFDTPSVRFSATNEYHEAMMRKAVRWKNERMSKQILSMFAVSGQSEDAELSQASRDESISAFEREIVASDRREEWATSAALARFAIRNNFRSVIIYVRGASALASTGAYEEARDLLIEGEDILSDDIVFLHDLARYECLCGNLEAAEARLEQAAAIDEDWKVMALEEEDFEPLWETLRQKWGE